MVNRTKFYIDGAWVDPAVMKMVPVVNPATEEVITEIAGPAYAEFAKTVGPLAEDVTSMSWWHPAVRYKGPDVFGSTEAFNAAYAKANGCNEADYIEAGSAACGRGASAS